MLICPINVLWDTQTGKLTAEDATNADVPSATYRAAQELGRNAVAGDALPRDDGDAERDSAFIADVYFRGWQRPQ